MRLVLALAWLRWRTFRGGLVAGRKRTASQRWARVFEAVAGGLMLLVGGGLAAALAAGAFIGGRALVLHAESREGVLLASRLLAAFACSLVVLLPLQAASGGHSPTRLLLLPVSRRALATAGVLAAAADPAVWLAVPAFLALGAGVASAGAPLPALVALVAGALMAGFIVGFESLVSGGARLLMQDRRRAEMASLAALLLVVCGSFLPALLANRLESGELGAPAEGTQSRVERDWGRLDLLPPGLHARAVARALDGEAASAAAHLAGLGAASAAVLGGALAVQGRLLADPSRRSRRRLAASFPASWLRLPGLSDATLAVASATVRTCLRTVRGKLATFTPPVVAGLMSVVLRTVEGDAQALGGTLGSAAGLLGWCTALALVNQQPLILNAFASDGAGFTLSALQPVSARELVTGKALGFAALFGVTLAPSVVVAAWLGAPASAASWATALVAAVVTLGLQVPVALLLSARFPKAADLTRLNGQQPHQGAALLGGLALMATLAAPRLAGLGASLAHDWLAPVAALACGVLGALPAALLLRAAALTLDADRERIALAAQRRE